MLTTRKEILIVEDYQGIRDFLTETLSQNGYEIRHCTSGEEMLRISRERKPDLVIIDIMFSGQPRGCDFVRLVKNSPETRDCPCLAIATRCSDENIIREARVAGAECIVDKPVSVADLIINVKNLISSS